MSDMMGYGHGFGMAGMGFMAILFWFLIIAGIFLIIRSLLDTNRNSDTLAPPIDEAPLKILQKRFAKGEIDEENFKRMKKELEE